MINYDFLFGTVLAYIRDMWKINRSVGHLVITSPLELRALWSNKDELTKATNKTIDFLKGLGFKKGFYNWHFAGESERFYPHLHVVLPSGYISSKRLNRIKAFFNDLWGIRVIYYGYLKDPDKLEYLVSCVLKPNKLSLESFQLEDFRTWGFW